MSYYKIFAVAALSVLLAACGNTQIEDPDRTSTTAGGSNDGSTFPDGGDPYPADPIPGPNAGELGAVIYFDFNSSEVRDQDRELVARHAVQLNENSFYSVRLEGHADERGSREYNIGLGERRGQAVRQMLMIQGVNVSQIQTVSFGEERPEAMGNSESDYARNRRVEIKYTD